MKYLFFLFLLSCSFFCYSLCEQPDYCSRLCWDPEGTHLPQNSSATTTPTHIIVHHTGDGRVFPENTNYKEMVQFYWDYHVNTNGWSDIGYNWLIDRNGVIYEGRGNEKLGAHFSCMSSNTTGIALIGNFDLEEPSTKAITSLKALIAWEATDKNIDISSVSYHLSSQLQLSNLAGHSDGNFSDASNSCASGTTCPGKNLYSKLPDLRSSISEFACYEISTPSLDCSAAAPLQCGIKYYGQNSQAGSNISLYGCNSWTETGPERVHRITPTVDGPLTATISTYTGDLDVYILGSCDPMDCLGTVSSSAAVYENAKAGETYYIVVDSDDGSGSGYELMVTCSTAQNLEDIFLSKAVADAEDIKTGDSLKVSVDLAYHGSWLAAELPNIDLAYYLSTDCQLSVDDILLATDYYNLGSDTALFSINKHVTIPTDITSGNYFLLLVSDGNNNLDEINTSNNSDCVTLNIALSVNDLERSSPLKVYPNPVENILHIETKHGFTINKTILYNSNGLKLIESEGSEDLNVEHLVSGFYILKVTNSNNETTVFKLVKE